jgi:CxxC-x17-CxxC domain-containing protein
MVKGGNMQVEQEVINSSRALYCRPKEVVEREINNWSGMSLGDDTAPATSTSMEKFPIICSLCGLEKTVPFKPEKGRPAYCKECIARIKSGEVKVEKGSENQIKYDESKFVKPLADLGIEFEGKTGIKNEEVGDRYSERVGSHGGNPSKEEQKRPVVTKPGVLSNIKNVFVKTDDNKNTTLKPPRPNVDNVALREVLNKAKVAGTVPATAAPVTPPKPVEPISLDTLKNKIKEIIPQKDKAASAEDMNKLKDLITQKVPTPTPPSQPIPPIAASGATPLQAAAPAPMPTVPPVSSPSSGDPKQPEKIKEVPEDVLRKILE